MEKRKNSKDEGMICFVLSHKIFSNPKTENRVLAIVHVVVGCLYEVKCVKF